MSNESGTMIDMDHACKKCLGAGTVRPFRTECERCKNGTSLRMRHLLTVKGPPRLVNGAPCTTCDGLGYTLRDEDVDALAEDAPATICPMCCDCAREVGTSDAMECDACQGFGYFPAAISDEAIKALCTVAPVSQSRAARRRRGEL